MNLRVKRLALFISFSAACLGSAYPAIAADPAATNNQTSSERARPPKERIPPVITLNGDPTISIMQTTIFRDPGATAVDAVDGVVRVRATGEVNIYVPRTYTLTYTATDRSGNTATATRQVTVVADTIPPVITLKGDSQMSILQGIGFKDPGYTVTENSSNANAPVKVTIRGFVSRHVPGVYTLTYIAKDLSGNESEVKRIVTVLADTTPPEVTLNGENPLYVVLGSDFIDPGITATDNSGKPVKISKISTVNTKKEGTYVITYFARDHVGNFTRINRTVIVAKTLPTDTNAPVISLNGAASIELTVGDTYTDAGATATDDVDGTVTVTTTGSVDTTTAGTYTLTYTAQDAAGNQATPVIRTVIVKALPNVEPTANAGTDQEVNELTAVTLTGSGTDNDGTIASYAWTQTAGAPVTLSNANTAQASFEAPDVAANTTLTFKLTVTDDKGATAEDTINVTVKAVDSTKPVITLNGAASIELTVGDTYTDAGATATDDVDGTVTVTTTGSVDTTTAGTYTLTYTAQDAAGNQATPVNRVIVVQPVQQPQATGKLNDTGSILCSDEETNELACPIFTHPGQDAESGRDFTHNDDSDGLAGFSFTLLDSNGQVLADQTGSTPWSCVQDNVTDLIWEVKTEDGGLHDRNWNYSWYEPNKFNAGNPGTPNGQNYLGDSSCEQPSNCNTSDYVTRVNTVGWCGASDWRLPTAEELLSIASFKQLGIADPFPTAGTLYWSSDPSLSESGFAWEMNFNNGEIEESPSYSISTLIMLVRDKP